MIERAHPAQTNNPRRCPLCGSSALISSVQREHIPVLTNLVMKTWDEARKVQRGRLDLVVCSSCGCMFNRAFDASFSYTQQYENSHAYAPSFAQYVHTHIDELVHDHQLQQCHSIEIGCGDGFFLRTLVEAGEGNTGVGFDPNYRGPNQLLEGRIQITRGYYDRAGHARAADVLLCRHVIERVEQPLPFLRLLRQTLSTRPTARAFFETPNIEWILRNRVIWDLSYEQCTYFSAETLMFALACCGFTIQRIQRTFHDQYLWVEATVNQTTAPPRSTVCTSGLIPTLAHQFQLVEPHLREVWKLTIRQFRQAGPVALLGAAGKGVTFANLIDPHAQMIACVVDLNPHKQDAFLPGTGHPIISYEDMPTYGITSAVLLNPAYYADTVQRLARLPVHVHVITDPLLPSI